MYNLLITDDEVLTLKNIKKAMEPMLERWEIERVFTAESAGEAEEIFHKYRIDILLSDVEMPGKSGLELANWVRKQGYETEIIFLTCHADFGYIKKAVSLESLDYLLKPLDWAELTAVMLKALIRLKNRRNVKELTELRDVIEDKDILLRTLWGDIVSGRIRGTNHQLAETARKLKLNLEETQQYILILISIQEMREIWRDGDANLMEYAVKNVASELLGNRHAVNIAIALGEKRVLVICCDSTGQELPELQKGCQRIIDIFARHLEMSLSCYLSHPTQLEMLAQTMVELRSFEKKNVYRQRKVFICQNEVNQQHRIELPDFEPWNQMLSHGHYDEAMQAIVSYFQKSDVSAGIDDRFLKEFRKRMENILYTLCKRDGLEGELQENTVLQEKYDGAAGSVPGMLIWINENIALLKRKEAKVTPEQLIEQVKDYIRQNIGSDISREDVAKHFFLNADYLSRIFKRQEGMALMEFLLQERLRITRQLLADSTLSISEVALSMGYSNFSHFSKLFKKKTGMTPGEYRARCRK